MTFDTFGVKLFQMIGVDIDINALIEEALRGEDNRSQQVLIGRYGLGDRYQRKTLAALGKEYKLTRERIRQIEAAALSSIRERIREHRKAIELLELLERYMENVGHVRRGDIAAEDVRLLLGHSDEKQPLYYNKLHFLVRVLEWPSVSGGNELWHVVWYSKPEVKMQAESVVEHLLNMNEHDFEKFLKSARTRFRIPEPQILNYLTLSKRFGMGPYGDLGATHWLHVNPKTVRDRAYLVLKKVGEPLHFEEIAERVNRIGDKKRAPTTVHNELIKDSRFVLVKRGTYAINE